jgi:hypothetical protein
MSERCSHWEKPRQQSADELHISNTRYYREGALPVISATEVVALQLKNAHNPA